MTRAGAPRVLNNDPRLGSAPEGLVLRRPEGYFIRGARLDNLTLAGLNFTRASFARRQGQMYLSPFPVSFSGLRGRAAPGAG